MRTVGELLRYGASVLRGCDTETPDMDSRLLLAAVADLETSTLLARRESMLGETASERFLSFLERRAKGEPVHRILERRGFYGHDFTLSPETLEPRPDTEIVVELAIEILKAKGRGGDARILDIGTGSGAIAISILMALPDARAVATDISEGALRTSIENAKSANVAPRYDAILCEYGEGATGPFDLIVSNPPYIPSGDIPSLSSQVRDFDPVLALDGGPDGLTAYRAIAGQAGGLLAPGGAIVLEIGVGQSDDVTAIFQKREFVPCEVRKDYGGIVRALQFDVANAR